MISKIALVATPLAAVLAVSMILAPSAYALSHIKDARGDTVDPNFDITQAGFDGHGNPFIKVSGEAGGTPSAEGCSPAYAYVFAFTNGDHFAIVSHDCFSDSNEGNGGSDWHAHALTVSTDASGHFACVTGATDDGVANIKGHRATLEGTSETELDHVASVTIVGGAPTASCPDVGIGAALYVDVLDLAAPAQD
jgi:hypothetical protein